HAHARNYPPSPRTLGTGQLKGGARGVFARLLATPTVDRSDLYVVADAGPGTGNGYLAAYATTALYRAVGPAAALEARRLAALAQGGFRIKVVARYVHNVHHSMFTPQQWIEWDTKDEHGPAPMPGRTFRFQVAGGSVDLTTDVDSVVWLDAAYLDQTVQVDTGALPDLTSLTGASDYTSRSTASVKLDSTDVRTLEVAVERWEKEDS
ncbi:MAG: hypothetical protein QOJ69_1989, partial [Actinomycetota bacterium]|nr:hypothetical protein [Actinomycetota bacterium]